MLYAARDGCYECVDALIDAGADVNMPTPEGVTALMLALDNDHNDVAKLLLDRGANPRVWDWWGRTALYIAIDRKESPGSERLRGGTQGADPQALRASSAGFEHGHHQRVACRRRRYQCATQYASSEPQREQRTLHRSHAGYRMHAFAARDHRRSRDPIPDPKAKAAMQRWFERCWPKARIPTSTPWASRRSSSRLESAQATAAAEPVLPWSPALGGPVNMEMMELLLQHGANVNDQVTGTLTYSMRVSRAPSANEGRTALHIAAQEGKTDLVRYLLQKAPTLRSRMPAASRPSTWWQPWRRVRALLPQAHRPPEPRIPATVAEIRSLLKSRGLQKIRGSSGFSLLLPSWRKTDGELNRGILRMHFAVPRANDQWWLFPRLTSKPFRQIVCPHEAEQTDKRRLTLTKDHGPPTHNHQTRSARARFHAREL